MAGPLAERTLITAVVLKGVATIHTNVTTAFRDIGDLLDFAVLSMSTVWTSSTKPPAPAR